MNPPRALVDLHRGYNRETRQNHPHFATHRRQVTDLVLAAGGQSCALLGAGNCNDVELAALAERFREVHLVDLDREAIERARDTQPPEWRARLTLHAPVDLGGGLDQLGTWRQRALTAAELGALPGRATSAALAPLGFRADVVLSACLLSQIVHTCDKALPATHPQREAVACALVVAHLRTLVQLIAPGGVGLLVTDTVSSDTYPLDELWGTRTPLALLDELERAGNHLSGTSPKFLRRILHTDDAIAGRIETPTLIEPWLWRFNAERTLLTYALAFRRRGDDPITTGAT